MFTVWVLIGVVIAAAVVVAMLAVFSRPRDRGAAATPLSAPTPRLAPGRLLIEVAEDAGKEEAGRIIVQRLGDYEAARFVDKFAAALKPPAAAASAAADSAVAAPAPVPNP